MTCYNSFYPFQVLSEKGIESLEFSHITVFYGGNGSGKTTALNIIGESLGVNRGSLYNRSSFFEEYTRLCHYELNSSLPENSRIITSDDVFDYILNVRSINSGVDERREELFERYNEAKFAKFKMSSLEDLDRLREKNSTRSTKSSYVKKKLKGNVREHSNGENAYFYFFEKIKENGLYLLDEPENSLSPSRQLEILDIIEDCAGCLGCQFVIATHSPFLLSAKGARIYDFDSNPLEVKEWTELENVRLYYDFFKKHREEFE